MRTLALLLVLASCGDDTSGGSGGHAGTGGSGGTVDAATDGNGQCLGIFESCMFGGIPCCSGLVCSGNVTGQCLSTGTDAGP